LRKQIVWLIRERGLPAEIEGVVRDFWDLRVRGFGGLRAAKERKGKKGRSDGGTRESSDGEMMMFSSQGESEAESDMTTATDRTGKSSRIKSWAVSEGQKWAMPNLMDTLALGYVACLVMRRPIRIGDVLRAARSGRLLFVGAVSISLLPSG
jgi:RNA polymerase I-specific transcription initiation factor RRN7